MSYKRNLAMRICLIVSLLLAMFPAQVFAQEDVAPQLNEIPTDYLQLPSIDPTSVNYFDLVDGSFDLTPAELEKLAENQFVVTDNQGWERFIKPFINPMQIF